MNYKTLEELKVFINTNNGDFRGPLCHLYAFFLEARKDNNTDYWILGDQTIMDGLKIKLVPPLDNYPLVKVGDVVRIHRLGVDHVLKTPYIPTSKNVVVWPSFQETTTMITTARNPTINPDDEEKRRNIEALYCSKIFEIRDLKNMDPQKFLNTAGRIEEKNKDRYGNLLLTMYDGTATVTARVFVKSPTALHETNQHFETADDAGVGDYILICSGRLDAKYNYLNLSANPYFGRCLRKVEKFSILGSRITHTIEEHEIVDVTSVDEVATSPPRKSPRLQASSQQTIELSSSGTGQSQSQDWPTDAGFDYTKLSDISKNNRPAFCNIVGQVRNLPNETRNYGNWVLQLYDGSKIEYENFHIEEVKEPVQDCVTVLVYSKQSERDTDKHIETVKKLNDGDLVLIKNVRVAWRNDKLKIELNANLDYGKAIELIDRESSFGRRLMEIVTNPIVEELLDDPHQLARLENESDFGEVGEYMSSAESICI